MVTKAYIAIARANAKGNLAPHECAHHCRPSCPATNRPPGVLPLFLAKASMPWTPACAAFEDDAGRWQVAIHFRNTPDEAGLRDLVKLAAGQAAADALSIERIPANDWVARKPCRTEARARGTLHRSRRA